MPRLEYTRVSEDASILCRRQDFPRAVNVLQRRKPEHQRWRLAFRQIASSAARALDGSKRHWATAAVREIVSEVVEQPWLRCELALDLHTAAPDFGAGEILPEWTARDLWRLADAEDLPMEYIVQVAQLPRSIDAVIDTAQLVLDCRRTASAHRRAASNALGDLRLRMDVSAHRDAADRWQRLGQRLLMLPPRSPIPSVLELRR
jgi:hypothetical protein